jgi:hypothetical protein
MSERIASPREKRAKPKTAKPRDLAFINETPCENCGCEWFGPTIKLTEDMPEAEMGTACANPWCEPIRQARAIIAKLQADRLLLAKLAAETPQFFNPLEAMEAQALRNRILATVPT